MADILKERPAYVTFCLRPVEDREASIAAGHTVLKDVAYAYITPPGSKDRIERIADEWIALMKDQVRQERLPQEFYTYYNNMYEEWKKSGEVPVNGTAIKNWPVITPSQLEMLTRAHILTVEDLAIANEEALSRLGMGGRALKQSAIDWLNSAQDIGKTSSAISALRAENEDLRNRNKSLEDQIQELAAQVKLLSVNMLQETPVQANVQKL